MRAIVSVFDKTGVVELAKRLEKLGVQMFSTGGTKKALVEAGVTVKGVSDITGFPEILGGRVKTLHPKVHGGILAKRNSQEHVSDLEKNGIEFVDMVICNLYPFAQTIAREGVTVDEALEQIDIGGPTMIRASAKNFPDVVVVVNPTHYDVVLTELEQTGAVSRETRAMLAAEAFQHTAHYDTVIAQYLRKQIGEVLPRQFTIALDKVQEMRYGENPHQKAAFYAESKIGIANARQHQGKELSFNNILDADGALALVLQHDEPCVSIMKHVNPCGMAIGKDSVSAYRDALAADPLSAFGGIIGSNRVIEADLAKEIIERFYEMVVAPGFTDEALQIFTTKDKLRLLTIPNWEAEQKSAKSADYPTGYDYRRVRGGLLVQDRDRYDEDTSLFKVISKRQPTEQEMKDLLFAWSIVGRAKSNAIVFVKDQKMVGIGTGQQSRVISVDIAGTKAGEKAKGSAMASDAFFPFADGVETAYKYGVTSVIHPGGSIRDEEVLTFADEHDMAMVVTAVRHFYH